MKVLLAHPGTQHSRQLAKQLYEHNMLFEFHTGIGYGKDHWTYKLCSRLPASLFNKISNRFIDHVPDRFVRRHVVNELKALMRIKMGADEEKTLFHRNNKFQKSIPSKSIAASDVVIGFDTSSLVLIQRCKKLDTYFILDASIGHPASKDTVYKNLLKLYPEWQFTVKQKPAAQIKIEEEEMKLSDHIVVASRFTLLTYTEHGVQEKKISVNPYGVNTVSLKPVAKQKDTSDPVHFVFVGLVDARKGVPFLLDAWRKCKLNGSTLTIIGPINETTQKIISKDHPSVIIKGRLSHKELTAAFPHFDVMIFPSFFEGYGLVIPEAMACGLPVITTVATCGPDIIGNGEEGYIIEPGDEGALINAIETFINQKDKLVKMGVSARAKAEKLSWETYGNNWEKIIENATSKKPAAVYT